MIPWWILEERHDIDLALMQCAFMDEIESGHLKSVPEHIQRFRRMVYEDVD